MTLRHYGGRTPTVDAEWTCPSCAHVQTGPLKAGCQQCGAGGDAKRVEAGAVPQLERPPLHARDVMPSAQAAFEHWADKQPIGHAGGLREVAEEAFMAGVAWAQAQPPLGDFVRGPVVSSDVTSPVTPSGEAPYVPPTLLMLCNGGDLNGAVDAPTLQTILAALAFYRDNQLGYGPVPGQLTAEQVSDLIQRLSPQESEA